MRILSIAALGILYVIPARADMVMLDRDLVMQFAEIVAHPTATRDRLFETVNQLNACLSVQPPPGQPMGNPQTCPEVAKAKQDQQAALLKAAADARASQKAEDDQAARKGP